MGSDLSAFAERALEGAVYATVPTGPALAAATVLGSPVGAWIVAGGLAMLLGAGFALFAMLGPHPRLAGWRTPAIFAGGALMAVPSALALAGVGEPLAALVVIALPGAAGQLAAVARRRAFPGAFAAWCATLPALLASAVAVAQSPRLGATAATATWAAASAPLAAAILYAVRRRRSHTTVVRSLDEGRRELAHRNFGRSVEEFDRAIAEAGTAIEAAAAWSGKGAALVALDRCAEGIACLDTALRLNPNTESAWLNRGNALAKLGQALDALRSYNAAIRVNPRSEIAWNNKGNALARMGRFPEALACYDRALEIDATYTAAWVNKGVALTKTGALEAAARCTDRAARLAADSVR